MLGSTVPAHECRGMESPMQLIHVWFATKRRRRILEGDLLDTVHEELRAAARAHSIELLEVQGVIDHVHILLRLQSPDDSAARHEPAQRHLRPPSLRPDARPETRPENQQLLAGRLRREARPTRRRNAGPRATSAPNGTASKSSNTKHRAPRSDSADAHSCPGIHAGVLPTPSSTSPRLLPSALQFPETPPCPGIHAGVRAKPHHPASLARVPDTR